MKRIVLLAAGPVLLSALLAVVLLRPPAATVPAAASGRQAPGEPAAAVAPASERESDPSARSTPPATPPTAPTAVAPIRPLPPLDAPLSEVLDELRQRADQGDMAAACRLGSELAHCMDFARDRARLDQQVELAAMSANNPRQTAAGREQLAQAILRQEQSQQTMLRHCKGVDRATLASAFDYQYAAATRGSPGAQLHFAMRPALDETRMLDDLQRWQIYRDNVFPLLEAAVARGNPGALAALSDLSYPEAPWPEFPRTLAVPRISIDPVVAYAYYLAALQAPEGSGVEVPGGDRPFSGLSPSQRADAQRLADGLLARFNAVPADRRESLRFDRSQGKYADVPCAAADGSSGRGAMP